MNNLKKILFSLFFSFSAVLSQENDDFWNKIKNSKDFKQQMIQIESFKKKVKLWETEDQLFYHKYLTRALFELRKFEESRIQSDFGIILAKKLGQDSLEAFFYSYKAKNFYYLQNKEKAIENTNLGVSIAEKHKFKQLKADLLTNLAIIRIDEVKIEEAEDLLEESIEIHKQVSDSLYPGFLQARYLLIACNRHTKIVVDVLPLCEKLLIDLRKIKDVKLLAGHLFFYSYCLLEKGNKEKAIEILDEAISITKNTEDIDLRRQALSEKGLILSQLGRFKEAYYASSESLKLYSELLKRDVAKAASDAEVKYQTKQKEALLKAQEITLNKERNEKILILISSFLTLAIFIGIVVFVRINQKLKNKVLIRKQKEESLNKIIEGQENERTRIAKELHDGIVQDLTVLKMNLSHNMDNEKIQSELTKITKEVRELSYQMMPVSLKELGLTKALEDLFDKSFTKNGIAYEFEYFEFEQNLDEKTEVNIYRICQELINNILKHSKADIVTIILREREGKILLIVEDNGLGFDMENIKSGIGLMSLQSRLESINGEIEFDSNPNEGTRAFIRISI